MIGIWPNGCQSEDESGRRCCWGDGHAFECLFSGVRLTARQAEALRKLAAGPIVGRDDAAYSLARRGLATFKRVQGLRRCQYTITPHGQDIANELPR